MPTKETETKKLEFGEGLGALCVQLVKRRKPNVNGVPISRYYWRHNCPECAVEMAMRTYNGEQRWFCPRCHGWYDGWLQKQI